MSECKREDCPGPPCYEVTGPDGNWGWIHPKTEMVVSSQEFMDLRAQLAALKDRGSCAYCDFGDENAPGGKRTFGELQTHIESCEHHPLAKVKAQLAAALQRAEEAERDNAALQEAGYRYIEMKAERDTLRTRLARCVEAIQQGDGWIVWIKAGGGWQSGFLKWKKELDAALTADMLVAAKELAAMREVNERPGD